MAEKIVIILYSICHFALAIYIIITRTYCGEAKGMPQLLVDNSTILFILLGIYVSYIAVYKIYKYSINKKENLTYKIVFHKWRFHLFYCLILVSKILFLLSTGIGKAGTSKTSLISFIFNFFNVDIIFSFYYFICREKKIKYFLNVILYCIYQLLCGWSGFVLTIAIYELFLFFQYKGKKIKLSNLRLLFYPGMLFIVGSKLYQYIYVFKNYIRYGYWIENLTYFDACVTLAERLSFFPISIVSIQNKNIMDELYLSNKVFLSEIQTILRPLVPGFLMTYKGDIRAICNLVVKSIYWDLPNTTGSNFGIISYSNILLHVDWVSWIIWIILLVLSIKLFRVIIKSCEKYPHQLDILYFMLLFQVVNIGSIETVFSYNFYPIFYLIPIFYCFRIIRIKKRRKNGL